MMTGQMLRHGGLGQLRRPCREDDWKAHRVARKRWGLRYFRSNVCGRKRCGKTAAQLSSGMQGLTAVPISLAMSFIVTRVCPLRTALESVVIRLSLAVFFLQAFGLDTTRWGKAWSMISSGITDAMEAFFRGDGSVAGKVFHCLCLDASRLEGWQFAALSMEPPVLSLWEALRPIFRLFIHDNTLHLLLNSYLVHVFAYQIDRAAHVTTAVVTPLASALTAMLLAPTIGSRTGAIGSSSVVAAVAGCWLGVHIVGMASLVFHRRFQQRECLADFAESLRRHKWSLLLISVSPFVFRRVHIVHCAWSCALAALAIGVVGLSGMLRERDRPASSSLRPGGKNEKDLLNRVSLRLPWSSRGELSAAVTSALREWLGPHDERRPRR